MSIFGGSERFPNEPARSPGPVYGKPDVRAKASVVMKADYQPVDENRKWGKRESWIGGGYSPHMPVVPKESSRAPGHYNDSVEAIKKQAPKVSFPKSSRFLSQKVNMTDRNHQRELMAAESPGPKYNVHALSSNGGRTGAPRFSFAPPPSSPRETRSRLLPSVDTPRRGHRESWLSVINRNGVLVMPASPTASAPRDHTGSSGEPGNSNHNNNNNNTNNNGSSTPKPGSPGGNGASTRGAFGSRSGSVFGNEHRFGVRQDSQPKTPRQNTRVQFVSARHTRENMGEFSPGPIYSPRTPECPGGRLAPAPPPESPPDSPTQRGRRRDPKNPHANMSSRSSWLAGAVRKTDGHETVLLRTGDVPPGPGSYAEPPSSFTTVSHNVKARSPSPSTGRAARLSPRRAQQPAADDADAIRAAEPATSK